MRLIDADKLKRKVQRLATEAWMMKLNASVETTLNQFIDYLDEAPTIEPKRGEWNKPNYGQCSNCRGLAIETESGYYFSDFCPNCGANMRKEK